METNIFLIILLAVIVVRFFMKNNGIMIGKNPNGAKYHKITADEVKQWQDDKEIFHFIDVRTPSEFNGSHIKGAKNIPLQSLKGKAESNFKDKESFIVVYCQSGSRSRSASSTLLRLGYTEVYDLGSINSWPYKKSK